MYAIGTVIVFAALLLALGMNYRTEMRIRKLEHWLDNRVGQALEEELTKDE